MRCLWPYRILIGRSQELLDWYGNGLCQRFSKVTKVICDDVFRQIDKHDNAVYLLDIRPGYNDATNDRPVRQADRNVGRHNVWA